MTYGPEEVPFERLGHLERVSPRPPAGRGAAVPARVGPGGAARVGQGGVAEPAARQTDILQGGVEPAPD